MFLFQSKLFCIIHCLFAVILPWLLNFAQFCTCFSNLHFILYTFCLSDSSYQSADKSLARPGRKQARKHVRNARDFNNIETRAVIKFFFFLQGEAPKEIQAILTETLACFLPDRAKDLSAPLYII